MPFELPTLTQATCTHVNPRTEMHGTERVRALDMRFRLTGENTMLDVVAPGLRSHLYTNKAADAAQETLPDVVIPLPNIRFPQLKTEGIKWDQPKARGYRWIWDWGRDSQHVDLSDAAMGNIELTLHEGGTVDTELTVSYNGQELNDNALYGELCGLAAMGDVHIQLFAPAELVPVKKGWRSGHADTPQTDGGAPLLEGDGPGDDDHDDDDTGNQPHGEFAEGSPEAALIDSVQKEPQPQDAWPFPPKDAAKRGRGRKAAAGETLQ